MIRRQITSSNGEKFWLLISQVDHARISGELVRNWTDELTPDVVDAIAHHDDGWAAWEAEPKLNPEIGAPFSFVEMPVPVALVIWDHSIAAAAKFGPLASFIVAGHFYNLLSNSDHANDPLAVAWLTAKRKLRTTWLDDWMRADRSNSLEYARRAQQMLLLADLFSLWLCCDAPTNANQESILGQSSIKLQTDALFGQFDFSVADYRLRESSENGRIEALEWSIAVRPYPCKAAPLPLSTRAIAAPAARYPTWTELTAASWHVELHWRLLADPPPVGPAS